MAKNFADCVAEAIRGGHLNEQEGKDALALYRAILSQGADDTKAKTEVAKQLEMEARERERRALKSAASIKRLQDEALSFRNASGEADLPKAWQMEHDRRGDEGKFSGPQDGRFGLSVQEMEDAIVSDVTSLIEAVTHEFRRGALTGDLKRQSKLVGKVIPGAAKTQARMSEFTKALRGEKTSDVYAQQLADIIMGAAEKIRLRFNEAGGAVRKLDGWGGPQAHNQDAVFRYGKQAWINFIMPLLDRAKMVHSLTKRALSDAELIESLGVVWERITTDGGVDEEKISGVPVGRGALWSQHADHRFLHFKSADDWMKYAKEFGNPDPYVSFMNWFKLMARDIAAMEKFGPNPSTTREYMKQWVIAKSQQVKPTATIIGEQTAQLKSLQSALSKPNPEYEALNTRLEQIHSELGGIRAKNGAMLKGSFYSQRTKARIEALQNELHTVEEGLNPFLSGAKEMTLEDTEVATNIINLLDEMREPIQFANTDNPVGYAKTVLQRTDAIWEFQRGSMNTPINSKTANVMATGRNIVTGTALNSAVLSAITDTAFQSLRRGFVGMGMAKSNPVTVLIETLKAIGTDNRRQAVRSGLIMDSAMHAWQREATNATKWAKARSVTSYIADRVMSLQGLNAWTQGGKHAFGMELMGHVADEAGKSWTDVHPQVREMLERAGFDATGWDKIRSAEKHEPKSGSEFLRPNEISDVSPELAQRYIAMILRETRYAIIEPTPTAKAIMLGGTRPGTVAGELVRGAGQLKTFPITVLMMHMGQTASLLKGGDAAGSARYVGAMMLTGTIMGAIAMSLKDINAGRDPRKWLDEETYADPNFWGAAILQSGGLGIYGDFLFSNTNRFGSGWGSSIAGPMIERAQTAWNLTGGNAMDIANNLSRMAKGEPTKSTRFGPELTRFMRQNFPTVVWNRLLMDRMVWDQMQKLVDPEAQRAFQRQRSTRKKDYGQDFWYGPGDATPARAPDLSRMFGTRK